MGITRNIMKAGEVGIGVSIVDTILVLQTFDILVNWFGFDIDMEMWSQQLSFIVVRSSSTALNYSSTASAPTLITAPTPAPLLLLLLLLPQVGIIVVTSTRGLLLTMSKFFIWLSSSKSSNILVLFFSQIMGMYFTSMVIHPTYSLSPDF